MAAATEWLEKDYYQILGVAETASEAEIRKAYRTLARGAHPDANLDDPDAEARFKEISTAYDVVGDADKRKEYDELRRMAAQRPYDGTPRGNYRVYVDDASDFAGFDGFGTMFDDLFGHSTSTRSTRPAPNQPRPGQDLSATLTLSFIEAVNGTSTYVDLVSETNCEDCNGTGADSASNGPVTCTVCGGAGQHVAERGGFAVRQTCAGCGGAGVRIEDPCGSCRGSGRVMRPRSVKVRTPAGVDDGQTIRLPSRGAPGRNGGPAGDLYVTVDVEPHPEFGRIGNNLTLTVPVTYTEAALGADIRVPTLDGSSVRVRVPPGTPAGRTLRVGGKGIPKRNKPGDLLLTIDIDVPADLSEQERDLIGKLGEASDNRRPRARWDGSL